MVTYSVTEMITCLPIIRIFIILLKHLVIKSGCNDPSKPTSCKALQTVLSHVNSNRNYDEKQH